ncbi:helix-turn-helix transcriptional regulator [Leucobacter ruminantium]|uniref:Helix-turn-helix domain-containing protein n=1 Tax=Leucobacter ruminantium TaxID=1289170 RepID=A0A939LWX2_9MICO|nr:helix-turn-helix domain-containing protein [Leucobacter ruminantium]MBO1803897.1 helix-turn-helix domain-containing protein [Leucobacter ruminantium]
MSEHPSVTAIGSLSDPLRMRLYRFIVGRRSAVSREEAAEALDIPVSKAKFHLDRLADEGVLDIEYRRLTGRRGPGAGRPAKLYRRSATEFRVSLPERRYDMMGHILAAAIERTRADSEDLESAIDAAALAAGRAAGAGAHPSDTAPAASSTDDVLARAGSVLTALGYEADVDRDEVLLRNCPFDAIARQHRELACGANRHFVRGVLDGADCSGVEAELEPCPGRCCVVARRHSPQR